MADEPVTLAVKALLDVAPNYDLAEAYYTGDVEEWFASTRLADLLGAAANRFRVNFCATPVDVLRERTVIGGWEHPSAQAILDQILLDNETEFEISTAHQKFYTFGDCFPIVWPDDTLPGGVAIYWHDPRSVRVFYDPSRPRQKTHAIQLWQQAPDEWRVTLYWPDRVERYAANTKTLSQAQWELEDTEPEPIPGVIPVFHMRNSRPYGIPEHKDFFGSQDMLNKITITLMSAIDASGAPQRYLLTDSAINNRPSGVMEFPSGEFSPDEYFTRLAKAPLESGPGSLWELSGSNLKVGQFPSSDSDNFLSPARTIIQMGAAVTDTPMHYFDISGDQPSGESRRAADAPLIKKVMARRDVLEAAHIDVFDYALALRGAAPGVTIHWEPVEQQDDEAYWNVMAQKVELGMPKTVAFEESGYDPDVVAEWQLDEKPDPVPPVMVVKPPDEEEDPTQLPPGQAEE